MNNFLLESIPILYNNKKSKNNKVNHLNNITKDYRTLLCPESEIINLLQDIPEKKVEQFIVNLINIYEYKNLVKKIKNENPYELFCSEETLNNILKYYYEKNNNSKIFIKNNSKYILNFLLENTNIVSNKYTDFSVKKIINNKHIMNYFNTIKLNYKKYFSNVKWSDELIIYPDIEGISFTLYLTLINNFSKIYITCDDDNINSNNFIKLVLMKIEPFQENIFDFSKKINKYINKLLNNDFIIFKCKMVVPISKKEQIIKYINFTDDYYTILKTAVNDNIDITFFDNVDIIFTEIINPIFSSKSYLTLFEKFNFPCVKYLTYENEISELDTDYLEQIITTIEKTYNFNNINLCFNVPNYYKIDKKYKNSSLINNFSYSSQLITNYFVVVTDIKFEISPKNYVNIILYFDKFFHYNKLFSSICITFEFMFKYQIKINSKINISIKNNRTFINQEINENYPEYSNESICNYSNFLKNFISTSLDIPVDNLSFINDKYYIIDIIKNAKIILGSEIENTSKNNVAIMKKYITLFKRKMLLDFKISYINPLIINGGINSFKTFILADEKLWLSKLESKTKKEKYNLKNLCENIKKSIIKNSFATFKKSFILMSNDIFQNSDFNNLINKIYTFIFSYFNNIITKNYLNNSESLIDIYIKYGKTIVNNLINLIIEDNTKKIIFTGFNKLNSYIYIMHCILICILLWSDIPEENKPNWMKILLKSQNTEEILNIVKSTAINDFDFFCENYKNLYNTKIKIDKNSKIYISPNISSKNELVKKYQKLNSSIIKNLDENYNKLTHAIFPKEDFKELSEIDEENYEEEKEIFDQDEKMFDSNDEESSEDEESCEEENNDELILKNIRKINKQKYIWMLANTNNYDIEKFKDKFGSNYNFINLNYID